MTASLANEIEVRLSANYSDAAVQALYVDVQIRNANSGQFSLAGQNYRFYFNSESLQFSDSESKSVLPKSVYSDIKMVNHVENVQADDVNQLPFDDNLGFINFSIDLLDVVNGGINIASQDEWVTVATLKFDILSTEGEYNVVWGRSGVTDHYATAFVQVSEWIQSDVIRSLDIISYQDFNSDSSLEETSDMLAQMSIGPNPAIEFVKVSFDQALDSDVNLIVRDINGRQLISEVIAQGSSEAKVQIGDLPSSNYFMEVYSPSRGVLHRDMLTVAH